MGRLADLAQVLRDAGLEVVEMPGWQTRGDATVTPKVVVEHHTASDKDGGPHPSLGVVISGRSDVPGPLSNLLLGRDAVFYVVAAGKSNNAGPGGWRGVSGNERTIGIEIENDGRGEPYPAAVYDAAARGTAALCRAYGIDAGMVCGHKEWAPRRKIDPSFDMATFRSVVADLLEDDMPLSDADLLKIADISYRMSLKAIADLDNADAAAPVAEARQSLRAVVKNAVTQLLRSDPDGAKLVDGK